MAHSPLDFTGVVHLLQAVAGTPMLAVTRVPWNHMVTLKRVLDAGATTLLVPFVQDADEARRAVAACRYPPEGVWGMAGMSRASKFGTVTDYLSTANAGIAVIVQLETVAAMGQLDAIAAALLPGGLVGAMGWTAYRLSDEATAFIEELPAAAQKIRQSGRVLQRRPDTAIDKVQAAATQLEPAAKESSKGATAGERGVTRVQIEPACFSVHDFLRTSAPGMAASIGQAVAVLFITFFLLSSGDDLCRKMVRLAGPTFARRKLTVQAIDEITEQIKRYLLVKVLISVLVGVATWLGFFGDRRRAGGASVIPSRRRSGPNHRLRGWIGSSLVLLTVHACIASSTSKALA
jgi:hypothetical protein